MAPEERVERAPRGVRRELAEGDAVTHYPPGAPFPFRFDSRRLWDGWEPRRPPDAGGRSFPGTAVLFEGAWYEVVSIEAIGARFAYHLAAWDETQPIRAPRELSAAACAAERRRQEELHQRARTGRTLRWIAPLVGLLPAVDQRRLEREHGVAAARTTLISAWVVLSAALPVAAVGAACAIVPGFVNRNPGLAWTASALPFAICFLLESGFRLLRGIAGEPAGSFPVVFVRAVWEGFRRRPGRAPACRRDPWRRPAAALRPDLVEEVPPAEAGGEPRLEIRSMLPKAGWTLGVTPISYRGAYWALEERGETTEPDRPFRYLLGTYPLDTLKSVPVPYEPDEVYALHRGETIARRAPWVGGPGALWGLLDASLQKQLQRVFGFEPVAETRGSARLAVLFGGLAALVAASWLLRGRGNLGDAAVLLGGIFTVGEGVTRLRRLDAGEIRGSWLGRPLAPLARRLLRGL